MGTPVDVNKFIEKEPAHTFSVWRERLLKQSTSIPSQSFSKDQVSLLTIKC